AMAGRTAEGKRHLLEAQGRLPNKIDGNEVSAVAKIAVETDAKRSQYQPGSNRSSNGRAYCRKRPVVVVSTDAAKAAAKAESGEGYVNSSQPATRGKRGQRGGSRGAKCRQNPRHFVRVPDAGLRETICASGRAHGEGVGGTAGRCEEAIRLTGSLRRARAGGAGPAAEGGEDRAGRSAEGIDARESRHVESTRKADVAD